MIFNSVSPEIDFTFFRNLNYNKAKINSAHKLHADDRALSFFYILHKHTFWFRDVVIQLYNSKLYLFSFVQSYILCSTIFLSE